ncbi:MAG: xanthine phosphoribosyltransferase [Moorella humiferrea]|uniref:Xanthine phosphoribosyltransferase n=1 Tax=Neomoorella humiferrea TaxID=676965 RepID=A0A2T0AYV4_9FIRM|nr:xanthine phosphoribosyltransferase [Moorella humiferrea]PRR76195.1 Xanthine phosphoribosyltransferase [Moorella humiferrea]
MSVVELLKEKIRQEGRVIGEDILKVDSFLNHQIDPVLMLEVGREFARRFDGTGITKVLTVEASGIAVALMTGLSLRVPVVFAKKKQPSTMDGDTYCGRVRSFTKEEVVEIVVAGSYLGADDRVLIIDDFLASGEAARGLIKIVRQAGATLVGIGTVIEKVFQSGGDALREQGIRVEALVQIGSLSGGQIEFLN